LRKKYLFSNKKYIFISNKQTNKPNKQKKKEANSLDLFKFIKHNFHKNTGQK